DNDPGSCDAQVNGLIATASDNCPGPITITHSSTVSSGGADASGIYPVGSTTIEFIATDAAGKADTCYTTVTVNDTADPVVVCQDVTIYLNAAGNANGNPFTNGALISETDNCGTIGGVGVTNGSNTEGCDDIGPKSRTIIQDDAAGNTGSCTYIQTTLDTIPPVAKCKNISIFYGAGGNVMIAPDAVDDGSSDNCSVTFDVTPNNFSCGPSPIVHNVELIVTDPSGNKDTCYADVTVSDTTPPVITCPGNVTVDNDPDQCGANISSLIATATDNCSFNITHSSPFSSGGADASGFYPVGTTTIEFIVTDVGGNADTCYTTVTVNDAQFPFPTCVQNIAVALDPVSGTVTVPVGLVDNGSFDNCGIDTIFLDKNFFTCAEVGINAIELTVRDAAGNENFCTTTIDIQDKIKPKMVCQDASIKLDATGNAMLMATAVDGGSTDACGVSLAVDPNKFTCADLGDTNSVVLTGTDPSGNSDTCHATVTVSDNIDPVALCKDSVCVILDGIGQGTLLALAVDSSSTDNCTVASLALDITDFNCADLGANAIELVVTDQSGNTDTCYSTAYVKDTTAPDAICQDVMLFLDNNGQFTLDPDTLDGGSTDNCGPISFSASQTAFDCSHAGDNTIILTATDPSGNSDTCSAVLTLKDTIDPVAVCQNITLHLDASGQAFTTAQALDGGSTDNCDLVDTTASQTDFSCADITETNAYSSAMTTGNQAWRGPLTNDFDVLSPSGVIITEMGAFDDGQNGISGGISGGIRVAIYDLNAAAIVAGTDVIIGSSDVLDGKYRMKEIAPVNLPQGNYTVVAQGYNTAENNGNRNLAGGSFVSLNGGDDLALGLFSRYGADNTATLFTSFPSTVLPSGYFHAGTFTYKSKSIAVDLVVTDAAGNTDTCTAYVELKDTIPPTALCNNFTIQLDANGEYILNTMEVNGGSSDNCSFTGALSQDTLTCADVGTAEIVLTITDICDNQDTCIANVIVEDTVAPEALCQDRTIFLNAAGTATISGDTIDNGSSDACGIDTLTLDINTFTCADTGANEVVLTATDNNGNTDTCHVTVTILDTVSPEAICKNDTIYLDASGNAILTTSDIDNGSNDACGIFSIELDSTQFDCSEAGENVVELTVTDNSGNTSTCTAVATVLDTIDPDANCKDIDLYLDAAGNASITPADADNGSTDNCGAAALTLSIDTNDYSCADLGANANVLTATDAAGNMDTCNFTVNVFDTIPPVTICQDITIYLNKEGYETIVPSQLNNGSSDACGPLNMVLDIDSFVCSDVGTNDVILTITDGSGNSSSDTCIVTVEDTVPPMAMCQDITVALGQNGKVTITAIDVDNGSNDACGLISLAIDNNMFTCADTGDNIVTLTVTDVNGNSASCTSTVTVIDDKSPTAICTFGISVGLDQSGQAFIPVQAIDNGSFDNCGICDLTLSPNMFDCSDVGTNIVFLTATDCAGNENTCTTTVTVQDKTPPKAFCQDISIKLDDKGLATITGLDLNDGSSDNCGIVSYVASPDSFDCSDLGTNTATLTVTDAHGNSASCTSIVTVLDNIAPEAVCQNISVKLDSAGQATINGQSIDGGSSDNCSISLMSATPNQFTCADTGLNKVLLTVIDIAGNTDTCTAIVEVLDNQAPIARCQDLTWKLDATGGTGALKSIDFDNGSTDNCGIASIVAIPNQFTCADTGTNNVVLTVTDAAGNFDTCHATIEILDNEAPDAICTDVSVKLDSNGSVSITPAMIGFNTTDNCKDAILTLDKSTFTCADTGANTVILTATDASGNFDTCTATVTVSDNIAPTAVCKDIKAEIDSSGFTNISGSDLDGGSSDNCGIAEFAIPDFDQFKCTDKGMDTVTVEVIDASGNKSTCTAIITINDKIAPTAVCQDASIKLDMTGQIILDPALIDGGSWDNCSFTRAANPNTFTCADTGKNTVILTVTDISGNSDTCKAIVTVNNNSAPTAACMDVSVKLDSNGLITVTPAMIDSGSMDPCGLDTLYVSPSDFTCADTGVNTVTLTVIDNSGNMSSCTAEVTVLDNRAPEAVCNDLKVELDSNGLGSITVSAVAAGSSDNCGIDTMYIDQDAFNCTHVGLSNTVKLTLIDAAGNASSCNAKITVNDNIGPIAECKNIKASLDSITGEVIVTPSEVDNGSFDACGIAGRSLSDTLFNCGDVGSQNVTLTITDNNGNTASCNAIIDVNDKVNPVALCNDLSIKLDKSGVASITALDIDNGSSDACGTILKLNKSNFTCADTGDNLIILTAMDPSGNEDTCHANVHVSDNTPPTPVCTQGISVTLGPNGSVTLPAWVIDNGSFDNCGIASKDLSPNKFTCLDIGMNTVKLTVTDAAGNSAFCITFVNVQENISPVAKCKDITIYLDSTGQAGIGAMDVDNGSFDNCAIDTMTVSPNTFDCSNVDSNIVTLTVIDESGNVTTCNANVTVLDTVAPEAVCQDNSAELDSLGMLILDATILDGGSSDACGVASITVDHGPFMCAYVGTNTLNVIVTDSNGNVDSCSAVLTVLDVTAPAAVCQDITAYLDSQGTVKIDGADVDGGSSDACGIGSLFVGPNEFDCSDVGPNTVTLVVTDVNGNSRNCTATVTVEDTLAPVALCQDIPVKLDASGNATITPAMVDNGSNDPCGPLTYALDVNSFTCANVGPNPVTLTVTDANGNSSSCSATVSISDNTPPIALCKDITIELDSNGLATITGIDIDGGSNDACGVDTLVPGKTTFTCADLGANSVLLTVTDVNGNSSACSANITVEDNIFPTITCGSATIYLNEFGFVQLVDSTLVTDVDDNCSTTLSLSQPFVTCADTGSNSIVVTATDPSGNATSCFATVTVIDTVSPDANCADPIVKLGANGQVTLTVDDIDAFSFDACGPLSRTIDSTDFDCSDIGQHSVTLVVTDVNGNSASCISNVTIADNAPPTVTCKNLNVKLDSSGNFVFDPLNMINSSGDNCGIDTIEAIPAIAKCTDVGSPLSVTIKATDLSGNAGSCTSTVNVSDNVFPNAICADIDVYLDETGMATITPADVDSGSNDACGIQSLNIEQDKFDCSDVGVNPIILFVLDNNGNQSTCISQVTVIDTTDPTAVCANITVQLKPDGTASINASILDGGSTDECGIAGDTSSYSASQTAFTCDDIGTFQVVLTVTDVNGNSSTCESTVTVEDNINPIALCIQGLGVGLDSTSGLVVIPAENVDAGSFDNCSSQADSTLTLTLFPNTFSCENLGINTVVLTATDAEGNTQDCVTTIDVQDNFGICPNQCPTPGNLESENVDYTSADLSLSSAPNAEKYIIQGGKVGGPYIDIEVTDPNLAATGLKEGTTYEWRARIICDNGDTSSYSDWSTFTTLSCTAPINLSISNLTSSSVTLNWDAVAGAVGYRLIGGAVGQSPLTKIDISGGATTSFNASGLASGRDYQWAVYAYCSTSPVVLSQMSAVNFFTTPASAAKEEALSVELSAKFGLKVYPNPNEGRFNIELSDITSATTIKIFDLIGQEIMVENVEGSSSFHNVEIDMGQIEKGTYIIEIISGDERKIQRVVIQ
ncbi:MAG: HYR domain-containing protein, partial [Bacteroidia bacterium]|nr:HYR domain-containing protein [Bacteroidia bacterium]